MSYRVEIRIAGEGGQGVVTGGIILAEAASVYEGKNAVMTQAYAAQQRGGPARAEVIVSDERIDYPKVIQADLLLALNQDAYDRYHHQMKRDGVIIVESARVGGESTDHVTVLKIPMEEISIQVAGGKQSANLVGLGVLSGLNGIVSPGALRSAIKDHESGQVREHNIKALAAGVSVGRSMKKGKVVSPRDLVQETHG